MYWQYSTSEVLVLEYCPGTKINDGPALDAQGLDRQRLARLVVESYLQQILTHGFFHAGEPQSWCPGRLAVVHAQCRAQYGGSCEYDCHDLGRVQ